MPQFMVCMGGLANCITGPSCYLWHQQYQQWKCQLKQPHH